ncbi:hypothetical protein JDV02_010479 [Purpureocillium takamizusanense]|uniref:Uncharacterized protein n=1 Tax=Purpureocillium takamizusanense TaxID=2060973 RepID=A0A9Q8VHB2_9HYPO|nr:uncharacterized protein JDV02_010479 [Purpureocillium takamizusanense]UNI24754.1 hypothetical protein JDV02_010479 [Purpureocillium takamizusanense]
MPKNTEQSHPHGWPLPLTIPTTRDQPPSDYASVLCPHALDLGLLVVEKKVKINVLRLVHAHRTPPQRIDSYSAAKGPPVVDTLSSSSGMRSVVLSCLHDAL